MPFCSAPIGPCMPRKQTVATAPGSGSQYSNPARERVARMIVSRTLSTSPSRWVETSARCVGAELTAAARRLVSPRPQAFCDGSTSGEEANRSALPAAAHHKCPPGHQMAHPGRDCVRDIERVPVRESDSRRLALTRLRRGEEALRGRWRTGCLGCAWSSTLTALLHAKSTPAIILLAQTA